MDLIKQLWELLSNPSFFKTLFGGTPPHWYLVGLQPTLIVLILVAIIGFIWKNLSEPIAALFKALDQIKATPAERERIAARTRFVDHILSSSRKVNEQELWDPRRFTELEAEYYSGNIPGASVWMRARSSFAFGPRRVKAIAHSLGNSNDRIALVEGDPGSGKSVLLREVANRVCSRTAKSWKRDSPVAVYFNLKMLDRNSDQQIDAGLIRQFIIDQTKRSANSDLASFLEKYFDEGLQNGWWLFLLDSFDEIPEVLSADDLSDTIDQYSQAIVDFATDFNSCRTLLATRHFRRPKNSSLPKFRILPLSDKQRNDLIQRAALTESAAERLYKGIAAPGPSLRYICENPMYLGLLIEFVRQGSNVPSSPHELFASFVRSKFDEKKDVLRQVGIDSLSLGKFAETAAFFIVEDSSLSLNPTREALLARIGISYPTWQSAGNMLDLLETLRISRGEGDVVDKGNRFTFSHRRFQEYFATCYVVRVHESVSNNQLLLDARWRETASVLLGSENEDRVLPLLSLSQMFLDDFLVAIQKNGQLEKLTKEGTNEEEAIIPAFFEWPPASLHLLSILQDGFADDSGRLPSEIRTKVSSIVRSGFWRGRLEDRRVALEVAGTLPDEELIPLLRAAISFGSRVLDDIAFRQLRSLRSIPNDVSLWIRITLLRRAGLGQMVRDRRMIFAFLSRVPDDGRLLNAATLLSRICLIDSIGYAILAMAAMADLSLRVPVRLGLATAALLSHLSLRLGWLLIGRFVGNTVTIPRKRAGWRRWIIPTITSNESQRLTICYTFAVGTPLLLRSYIISMPAVFFDFPSDNNLGYYALGVAIIISLWAPMATVAVLVDRFTALRWWPWLTFYPLLQLVSRPAASLRAVSQHIARYAFFYGFLAIESLAVWLFASFGRGHQAYTVPIDPIFVAGVLFYGGGIGWAAFRWCRDWNRLRRFESVPQELAPADFLRTLELYSLNSFRARLIRFVSGNALLPNTDRSLDIVRNLALALERDLSRTNEEVAATGCVEVDEWRSNYVARRKRTRRFGLSFWGKKVLDELVTLEQRLMELRRAKT
ncbi:NACHT domain-containing protein [Tunturiibacter gelidoferens]|uniref:NACHT domain-containing protein n=1 Tax=Tunturiibacter gelidiferens TaxID=3069689 RepID=A0A9X0QDN7_9BACT|nr:NACHT domain-containing protein [Edaphobacter lichenicola]MBB5328428.1 hypothetical protein [Edaphobacter lichenicola]